MTTGTYQGGISAEDLRRLCPDLSEEACDTAATRLAAYEALLGRWAPRVNLVALADLPFLWERHLEPALALRPLLRSVCHDHVVDVGSGAGLPGLPLAVTVPEATFVLVESRRRRAHFLRQAVRELRQENVTVVAERVEAWATERSADVVLSRAVTRPGPLARLTTTCRAAHAFLLTTSGPRSSVARDGTAAVWERRDLGRQGTWTQLVCP